MRTLFKVLITLALVFASTFIIVKATGILSVDDIKYWLTEAKNVSPVYVGGIVFLLLFADLFIAVPTLTISIFAGYFLGWQWGFLTVSGGLTAAGLSGYVLSRLFGSKLIKIVVKDKIKRNEMENDFETHGFWMILLSRAVPILPEVTACLAGLTKMNFWRFLFAWLVCTIPYAFVSSYSGSISSVDNPKPAIYLAIGLSLFFWVCWYFFYKSGLRQVKRSKKEGLKFYEGNSQ